MSQSNADGSLTGTPVKLLSKNETTFNSSVSDLAYKINQRTLVVDKLLAALERNTGDDPTATWAINAQGINDGHWYNEAFNGLTIQISTTVNVNISVYFNRLKCII